MKIRNRYQERKEKSKNDIQKNKLEKFFNVKFQNTEQYNYFLDLLHKPMTFKKSLEVNVSMIRDLVSDGKKIDEVISQFNEYMDDYYSALISNQAVEVDEDREYYREIVEETMEDGFREIENLDEVVFLYKRFLEDEKDNYYRRMFKSKNKKM